MRESYVFLANGFEEIEALSVIDILRRAEIPVKTVSITSALQVTGAHGVTVTADVLDDNTMFNSCEWLILPGGMPGATNLYEFAPLQGLLENQSKSKDGRIAAICAAPAVVLGRLGLLKGESATCYPGFENMLGCKHVDQKVVGSGKFITANGPGSATDWALKIVEQTLGNDAMLKVANGMLIFPRSEKDIDHYFG